MSGVTVTPKFPKPFAVDASGPYIQNPIPTTTVDDERASLALGFPPRTMTPEVASGVPPRGQDVNGVLYMVSASVAAMQMGQPFRYDSAMATAYGGYQLGTFLGMADGTGIWKNLVDGNTTDPDAGGAGWVAMYRYGHTTKTGLIGGVLTLTAVEAASPVVVLEGTLVGNLQVELPAALREWLIVNSTTGAFSTTVKTAAGSGVLCPQGGFAEPTGVYGDGTNIYPTVAPLVIPSAVAATPDTFAVRDNLGQLYATGLNISQALTNPNIGAVLVEGDGLTGFVEKMSPANFVTKLFGARSLTANGYYTLPGGFIVQWGTATCPANGYVDITYPVAFSTFSRPIASGGNNDVGDQDNWPAVLVATATVSGFRVINAQNNNILFVWHAFGA